MNKQILPIAIIAIIASAAAYLLLMEKPVLDETPKVLFEDFGANADKLLSIKISNADGTLLTATKGMGNWLAHVDKLSNPYPVNQDSLKNLVEAMALSKIRERKTAKQAFFSRLGLQPLEAEDSQATLLEFSDGKKVWELLIGNKASSGSGHFVRLPDQTQTWLLDTTFPIPADQNSWLKETIFEIEPEHVLSVKRVDEKNWEITATNSDEQTYTLENMPEDRELKYPGVVEGMITNLVSLSFDDLYAADSLALSADQKVATLEVSLANGNLHVIELYSVEEDFYLSVNTAELESEHYWKGILYKLSSFTAGQLNKTLDDFLQEIESEEDSVVSSLDEGEAPGD